MQPALFDSLVLKMAAVKKTLGLGGASSGHITNLKQSIFFLSISMTLLNTAATFYANFATASKHREIKMTSGFSVTKTFFFAADVQSKLHRVDNTLILSLI